MADQYIELGGKEEPFVLDISVRILDLFILFFFTTNLLIWLPTFHFMQKLMWTTWNSHQFLASPFLGSQIFQERMTRTPSLVDLSSRLVLTIVMFW